MFHSAYEDVVRFASEGALSDELHRAKEDYIERTGELFESDASFERRMAAFLEWYVLDRPVSFDEARRPIELYVQEHGRKLPDEVGEVVAQWADTTLSLVEFRRAGAGMVTVIDLLTNQQHQVEERRQMAGVEPGDVLEARFVPGGDRYSFSGVFGFHPNAARRAIRKKARLYRRRKLGLTRLDLVHRVAYLSNRCERYRHLDPKDIFAEL